MTCYFYDVSSVDEEHRLTITMNSYQVKIIRDCLKHCCRPSHRNVSHQDKTFDLLVSFGKVEYQQFLRISGGTP